MVVIENLRNQMNAFDDQQTSVQVIALTDSVNPDLCHHMAWLGHNGMDIITFAPGIECTLCIKFYKNC